MSLIFSVCSSKCLSNSNLQVFLSSHTTKIGYTSIVAVLVTNKANLMDLIADTGLVTLLKLDQNCWFSARATLKFDGWPKKKQWGTSSILYHVLYIISNPSVNSNWNYSRERSIWTKIGNFLSHVTLKFDRWHWKTIGYLFYTMSSRVHHFKAMGEFKLELQSGNAQFGSKSAIFCPVWPWNLTHDLVK